MTTQLSVKCFSQLQPLISTCRWLHQCGKHTLERGIQQSTHVWSSHWCASSKCSGSAPFQTQWQRCSSPTIQANINGNHEARSGSRMLWTDQTSCKCIPCCQFVLANNSFSYTAYKVVVMIRWRRGVFYLFGILFWVILSCVALYLLYLLCGLALSFCIPAYIRCLLAIYLLVIPAYICSLFSSYSHGSWSTSKQWVNDICDDAHSHDCCIEVHFSTTQP